ncbi:MAG: NUDIX domain-containing protein [Planctomycetaceae bacterium]|nr:NUDIX domain-containing protein [Planctomycetaceae bacterium]
MDLEEEWFDVVDQHDQVLRQAPRSEVRREGLLHRATHVWVFLPDGKMLIHRRTATKEEEPLKLTSSACGHLSAGESYEQAAQRELLEELGIKAPISYLHKIPSGPEIGYEHTTLFSCVSSEIPVPDPREISSCEYLSIPELKQLVEKDPSDFTNPFRLFFNWYLESKQ